MARPDKVAVVEEVRDRLTAANATVLTEYRGLTVDELAQLRAELRRNDAEYKVAKNRLVRIAVREAGVDMPDELLTGPTAITFVAGDPVAVAKVLRAFSRDHPALGVKGGILEGRLLDAAETLKLADLASREELLARLAGMFEAMLAQPARLAHASLAKAARLFAALQQKKEDAGETAAEEPAEEAAAETPEPAAETPEENDAEAAAEEPSDAAEEIPAPEAAEEPSDAAAARPSEETGAEEPEAAEQAEAPAEPEAPPPAEA
jgi:large subunit ribosomal protein L10